MAARRLQKVVIENRDFEKLIRQYDRPVSFFYCDPPYFATEDYYKDVGFTEKDHIRLRDTLLGCSGKFLVSYNDCPEIRDLWDNPGVYIEEIRGMTGAAGMRNCSYPITIRHRELVQLINSHFFQRDAGLVPHI